MSKKRRSCILELTKTNLTFITYLWDYYAPGNSLLMAAWQTGANILHFFPPSTRGHLNQRSEMLAHLFAVHHNSFLFLNYRLARIHHEVLLIFPGAFLSLESLTCLVDSIYRYIYIYWVYIDLYLPKHLKVMIFPDLHSVWLRKKKKKEEKRDLNNTFSLWAYHYSVIHMKE